MKQAKRYISAILLTVIMLFGTTGCTSKSSQINDTLSEFEYACQNLDVNAILKCIDPDISNPIRLGLAIFSTIADADYEDIVDGLFDNISSLEFDFDFNAKEFLRTISITDTEVKAKKNTAVVTCKAGFELAGEYFDKYAEIDMIKKDEKWYISSLDFLMTADMFEE